MKNKNNIEICEKIYNTCIVLDSYCKNNQESEEIQAISPIVEYIRQQTDKLYVKLYNWK